MIVAPTFIYPIRRKKNTFGCVFSQQGRTASLTSSSLPNRCPLDEASFGGPDT